MVGVWEGGLSVCAVRLGESIVGGGVELECYLFL